MSERTPSVFPNYLNTESTQTRQEADPYRRFTDKYHAIRCLIGVGIFTPMDDLALYHGRAGEDGKRWRVQPAFNNHGDSTGNHNINQINALNTGTYEVARDFAEARSRGRKVAEIHRIMSSDRDAVVIRRDFDWYRLTPEQYRDIKSAFAATLPELTEGAPVDFAEKEQASLTDPRSLANAKTGFIHAEELPYRAARQGLGRSLAQHLGSAYNTRYALSEHPELMDSLVRTFHKGHNQLAIAIDGSSFNIPISREYLAHWFRNIHAIGFETPVWSATLQRNIYDYMLFDIEKINTQAEIEHKKELTNRRLGKIALAASEKYQPAPIKSLIGALEHVLYIKPHEIVDFAKATPGYQKIFDSQTGNREGYTLAEHTETVLRIFDQNFADHLPATVLPTMRMALLVHDLGKPEAARRGDRHNQKPYNLAEARRFMTANSVDPSSQKLILAMIGDGMQFTERWLVQNDKSIGHDFYRFCERTMQDYLDTKEVDSATVTGFRQLLEILQICDSGAYTSMATTRSRHNNLYYRNFNAFNASFEKFHGLTGHRVRFK